MAKFDLAAVWRDVKAYRQVYILTAITSFGGMLFGWDTGLIGGVLTMVSEISPRFHTALSSKRSPSLISPFPMLAGFVPTLVQPE